MEPEKKKMKEKEKEETFIGKRSLGTVTVETGTSTANFKRAIFEDLIKAKGLCEELKINTVDDMRLRNAKNNDFGPICKEFTNDGEECQVHELGIWDNKEFYVQKTEHEHQLYQKFDGNVYNILVREWKADTWELGPIYEVQIDKMLTYQKLCEFLVQNVFKHIPPEYMFAARHQMQNGFIRSDLAQKRWSSLNLKQWIGQTPLSINRDSSYIIVKDQSVRIKELKIGEDDEMIEKWASNAYVEHLLKKKDNAGMATAVAKEDALYAASSSHRYTNTAST